MAGAAADFEQGLPFKTGVTDAIEQLPLGFLEAEQAESPAVQACQTREETAGVSAGYRTAAHGAWFQRL
jgi:hypothetical protein